MVAGVVLGSALWWFALSGGVSLLGPKLNRGSLSIISTVSGAVLVGFGIFALASIPKTGK
jgi:putative LysE/RhtB family amino acid efflux pump